MLVVLSPGRFITVTHTPLGGSRGGLCMCRGQGCVGPLYFSCSFVVNLDLLLQTKVTN